MRRVRSESLHPTVSIDGDTARLVVDAIDPGGRFLDSLELRAQVRTPAATGVELALEQTAPGRYETGFDVAEKGTYLLRISATSRGADPSEGAVEPAPAIDESLQLGVHVAVPVEHRELTANMELLERITDATGGTLLAGEDNPFAGARPGTARPRNWRFPAVIAMLLLLVDVAMRRRGFRLRSLLAAMLSRGATLAART